MMAYGPSSSQTALALYAHIHQFEAEALYIDSRIAEKTDLDFEKYMDILRLAATDAQLFKGTG